MDVWWSLHLRREPASVPLARHVLLGTMASAGVDPDVSHEVGVALTEACANAVEHAAHRTDTGEDSGFQVTVTIEGGCLRVEITDTGPGFSADPGSASPLPGLQDLPTVATASATVAAPMAAPAAARPEHPLTGATCVAEGSAVVTSAPLPRPPAATPPAVASSAATSPAVASTPSAPASSPVPGDARPVPTRIRPCAIRSRRRQLRAPSAVRTAPSLVRPLPTRDGRRAHDLRDGRDVVLEPALDLALGIPADAGMELPDETAEHGRGLFLIRALMDHVQFRNHPSSGAVVSFDKMLTYRDQHPLLHAS